MPSQTDHYRVTGDKFYFLRIYQRQRTPKLDLSKTKPFKPLPHYIKRKQEFNIGTKELCQ